MLLKPSIEAQKIDETVSTDLDRPLYMSVYVVDTFDQEFRTLTTLPLFLYLATFSNMEVKRKTCLEVRQLPYTFKRTSCEVRQGWVLDMEKVRSIPMCGCRVRPSPETIYPVHCTDWDRTGPI